MNKKIIGLILAFILVLSGCSTSNEGDFNLDHDADLSGLETSDFAISFEGYKEIQVDGGDLSGHRQANVVVDIGFGDRDYWAFTNEYGQLVKVMAREIILQDHDTEPVNSDGRYYPDEAKVPGVESSKLDEGHIIADSLGGVANAYNITPQNSTLNRHGDQAYMEKAIREAGGCTDFIAIITYANNETQIPNHYTYTYKINGQLIEESFKNINPDDENQRAERRDSPYESQIVIKALDKKAEYIIITNTSNQAIKLNGFKILSVRGGQDFVFDSYTLEGKSSVKVGDSASNKDINIHWLEGGGIWSNSKSDPAELYDNQGHLVDRWDD